MATMDSFADRPLAARYNTGKNFFIPEYMAYIGGTSSIIMWTIMAYVVHSNREQETANETERLHKGFRSRAA
jgi:hypothetical protein